MAYLQGDDIEAIHINDFINRVDNIYGVGFGDSGYGQTAISLTPFLVSVGDDVESDEWTNMISAALICEAHVDVSLGAPFPLLSDVAVGATIFAHTNRPSPNFPVIDGNITTIEASRLEPSVSSVTVFPGVESSTRIAPWNVKVEHKFQVTFPSPDDARYFFNSGGQIRWEGERTGGSATPQNAFWTGVLNDVGTVSLTHDKTISDVGMSSVGYYQLNTSFQTVVDTSILGGLYYSYNGSFLTIRVRTVDGPSGGGNADNGAILEFLVEFNDIHAGASDSVDGTLTSTVSERRATSPLTINSPVYTNITELTAGS